MATVKRKGPAMAGKKVAVARRPLKAAKKGAGSRFQDAITIAEQNGLLKGARTELVRGRMPKALVARARAQTGVQSDTKLIEVALANLAVADEYPGWLISQRGTVGKDLDLEF